MQFLWMYVDELVGKGLELWVIGQVIFYAAMSFVPMALPLGILLASLIFFGNIGERLELLAMKAAGISLYRILAPLLGIVVFLSVSLFAFENTYMIKSQVKMWTLIYSAKSKALELEIPEGSFYSGIPGYSIFVKKRDKKHIGRMEDVMIYDFNGGTQKTRIIRADSGRIVMNKDKTFITWRLYNGQSFQNLDENIDYRSAKPISHARERFAYKEILVPFNANFKKKDDKDMGSLYIGKNLRQLETVIDSAALLVDSIRTTASNSLSELNISQRYQKVFRSSEVDSTMLTRNQALSAEDFQASELTINPDSIFNGLDVRDSLRLVRTASSYLSYVRSDASNSLYLDETAYHTFRTNSQEWHRKFTFPVACLVFFLIGAPLGAIIRKGGIGMPVVVSIAFFIIYYIINTFGHNMIVSQTISVELGMWLSTMVLLPIGLFLTYQATRDSTIFNTDAYANFFTKLLGIKEHRKFINKDILIKEADYSVGLEQTHQLQQSLNKVMTSELMNSKLIKLWTLDADQFSQINKLSLELEDLVSYLSDTQDIMLTAHLRDLPFIRPEFTQFLPKQKSLRLLLAICLPLSLPLSTIILRRRKVTKRTLSVSNQLLNKIDLALKTILSKQTENTIK